MSLNGVFAEASCSHGERWIVAEEDESGGDNLVIRVLDGGRSVSQAALPFPSAGLAGGRFILSPSGRYAILSLYSGQSQEGYELFRIGDDHIERVAGLQYTFGESADFAFAPDEGSFVMVLPFNCLFNLAEAVEEEECELRDGQRVIPFGELRIHEIAGGRVSLHPLEVTMALGHEPDQEAAGNVELSLAFVSAREIQVTVPWRERISVCLPPPSEKIELHVGAK